MPAGPATLPDLDKLDARALKTVVVGCFAQIEHLKLVIAKLRRMHFGRKSEKVKRHIEQLELQLDGLEAICAQAAQPAAPQHPAPNKSSSKSRKSRALPKHLPREIRTHFPPQDNCPGCGGA